MKDKKALSVISKYTPDKMWVAGVLMQTFPIEDCEIHDKGSIVFQGNGMSFNWGAYGQSVYFRYTDLASLRIAENTANLEIKQGDKVFVFCGDFTKTKQS